MSNLLDNIFINLRVIGKIPPKGRICATSPGQVKLDEEGYTSKIRRTLTRDSRNRSINLLRGLANDVTEISDNIISSLYFSCQYEGDRMSMFQVNQNTKKRYQLEKLARELSGCEPGFRNLLNTYDKDILMTSRIEEVEDKFKIQTQKIQSALTRIKASPNEGTLFRNMSVSKERSQMNYNTNNTNNTSEKSESESSEETSVDIFDN